MTTATSESDGRHVPGGALRETSTMLFRLRRVLNFYDNAIDQFGRTMKATVETMHLMVQLVLKLITRLNERL